MRKKDKPDVILAKLSEEEHGRLRYKVAVEQSQLNDLSYFSARYLQRIQTQVQGALGDFVGVGSRLVSNAGVASLLLRNEVGGLLQEIRDFPSVMREMWRNGDLLLPLRNFQGSLEILNIMWRDLESDWNSSIENAQLLYNSRWSGHAKLYISGVTLLVGYTLYNHVIRPWPRHDIRTELNCLHRTVVITGASSGIGYRLAYEFAKRGAFVILTSPDIVKARKARLDLSRRLVRYVRRLTKRTLYNPTVRYYDQFDIPYHLYIGFLLQNIVEVDLNLASTASIYSFTRRIQGMSPQGIDILINNAAVNLPPEEMVVTDEGKEAHFAVNYFGHFVLTNLLLGLLAKRQGSRIINLTCKAAAQSGKLNLKHFIRPYLEEDGLPFLPAMDAYAESKLAMYLFNRQLSKELQVVGVKNVTTYCVCPGTTRTFLNRQLEYSYLCCRFYNTVASRFHKKDWHAVQPVLHCALSPICANESGFFYENNWKSTLKTKHGHLQDEIAEELWHLSRSLMGVGHNSMLKLTEQMHLISHQNIFQLANNLFIHRRDVMTHLLLMEEKQAFQSRHKKYSDERGDARSNFTYFWNSFYLSGGANSGLIERWVLYNTHPSFRELQKEYDVWFECTGSSHYLPKANGKMAPLQFMASMPDPLTQVDIEELEPLYQSDSEPDEEIEFKERYYDNYIPMEEFI